MFKAKIKPDHGEPFVVEVDTRDGLKWERARKGRSIRKFEENASFEDLYSLTYVAVMRDGRFSGDITEFEETCAIERLDDDEDDDTDEAGPTQPGR